MILIVCENYRTSENVALAMGANTETAYAIYASNSIAVATIPENFIRQTPLCEMADGRYPFIPGSSRCQSPTKNWSATSNRCSARQTR